MLCSHFFATIFLSLADFPQRRVWKPLLLTQKPRELWKREGLAPCSPWLGRSRSSWPRSRSRPPSTPSPAQGCTRTHDQQAPTLWQLSEPIHPVEDFQAEDEVSQGSGDWPNASGRLRASSADMSLLPPTLLWPGEWLPASKGSSRRGGTLVSPLCSTSPRLPLVRA